MPLFSKEETPVKVEVHGKPLQCRICDHDTFYKRRSQLNTQLATFFNVDWANRSAVCYVCAKCSHIDWFLGEK
ncbi:hypothetical protein LVD13_13910 [Flavobacteriaceae bacterium D16]|nr:hypothetical protein [Flavobacteriaceae bacterium D16]